MQNRPIERYRNELRAVVKSKRGLGNDKSAQDFIDGCYRIFHNYVRHHTGLPKQQTLAEAAKVDLNLDPQNRLKDLIAKSAVQKKLLEANLRCTLEIGFSMWRFLMKKTVCGLSLNVGWTNRFGRDQRNIESVSICMACKGQG